MGTLKAEIGQKRDMEDSGCVEDESPSVNKFQENGYCGSAELLNLSDDVLLCILKYCSPLDLKALGYTCPRLARLIRDRTLWQTVDARNQPCGRSRLRWMMEHCLHAGTKELLLTGYAKQAEGCQGLVNRSREEVDAAEKAENLSHQSDASESDATVEGEPSRHLEPPYPLFRQHARLHINAQPLPRFNTSPVWPEELTELEKATSPDCSAATPCPGPQFTLSLGLLKQLRTQCSELTALSLDYCNINCETTGISSFPPKLKKLSLRGTKCYNLTNQSFLFKIQDCLPLLEELDVSECAWLEPAALLPLSKLRGLRRLLMRACPRLAEFVAYCALATRYGFPSLQVVDLRGSPVGDSEISGLGWVRSLRELYVSAPPPPRRAPTHAHCRGDALLGFNELQPWEIEEPEFFRSKKNETDDEFVPENETESVDESSDKVRSVDGAVCVDGNGYTHCTESVKIVVRPREPIGGVIIRRRNGPEDPIPVERIGERAKSKFRIGKVYRRTETDAEEARIEKVGDIEVEDRDGDIPQDSPEKDNINKRRVTDGKGDIAEVNGNEPGPSKRPRMDDEKPSENIDEPGPSSKEHRTDDEKPKTRYLTFKRIGDFGICDGKFSQSNNASSENGNEAGPSPKSLRTDDGKPSQTQYVTFKRRCDFGISQSQLNNASSENGNEAGPSPKSLRTDDGKPSQTQYITIKRRSDIKIDELKKIYQTEINSGASTSKGDSAAGLEKPGWRNDTKNCENTDASKEQLDSNVSNASDVDDDVSNCSHANNRGSSPSNSIDSVDSNIPKFGRYIRFRHNQDPVVIQCPQQNRQEQGNPQNDENPQLNNENPPENNGNPENQDAEPRHHILYVNVGQQLHAIYRLLRDRPHFNGPEYLRNFNNDVDDLNDPPDNNIDTSTFVSDLAVSSFGRADSDNVNYIHIGQNGPVPAGASSSIRPSRSNLRVLSMTGYRNITDRSLVHLAAAAPYLRFVDFSRTNVTERGVENFKSLRPDCEVVYSPFTEKNEASNN